MLDFLTDQSNVNIAKFHDSHVDLFEKAKGSSVNHQAWEGGYKDHLIQCFEIANRLYKSFPFDFDLNSAYKVLYFHDIEKMWKYTVRLSSDFDKNKFYTSTLPKEYDIFFTDDELNALKYIHGEGEDYKKDNRVMNSLAAFCHCCDVLSARCFYDKKRL